MQRITRIFICTVFVLLLAAPSTWGEERLLPQPSNLVNDSAFVLSAGEVAELEGVLRAYMDSTSRQVFVVTVVDFKGYDANSFATGLGNQWAAGQRGLDNGVIILFRPGRDVLRRLGDGVPMGDQDAMPGEADRGEGYIAVGYGLEPVLPDVLAARITREIMGPAVVQGRFFDGLMATSLEVIRCTSGDPTTLGEPADSGEDDWMAWLLLLPSVGIFFMAIFRAKNDPQRRPFIIAFIVFFLWLHLRLIWLIISSAGRGGSGGGGGGGSISGGGGSFGGGGGGSRF